MSLHCLLLAAMCMVKLHIASIVKKSDLQCPLAIYSAAKGCSDFDPSLNSFRKSRSAPVTTKLEKFS